MNLQILTGSERLIGHLEVFIPIYGHGLNMTGDLDGG